MIRNYILLWTILSFIILTIAACGKNDDGNGDPTEYPPATAFNLKSPESLPLPDLPEDNPLTNEGVQLGRMLFYEKALSKDHTIACASCHVQSKGFSDPNQFSLGVGDSIGTRNAMALFNLMWHNKGFFWDGRTKTLREQALQPIENPLEMNTTHEVVVERLSKMDAYKEQFGKAFGDEEITTERMGLAMEQFMMTMISGNSKFDRVQRGDATYTDAEARGQIMFFTQNNPDAGERGADCFHCHGNSLFSSTDFVNNGLDETFTDLGYYETSKNEADKGKFKVPSLRNIALTAPYMHDGRFETLEEAIDHYNSNIKDSPSLDPNIDHIIGGLKLTESEIADLTAFLRTLTDSSFINNPAFSNPF